jgi:hypothetical protein
LFQAAADGIQEQVALGMECQLMHDVGAMASMVFELMPSSPASSLVVLPVASNLKTSTSRSVKPLVEIAGARGFLNQLSDEIFGYAG